MESEGNSKKDEKFFNRWAKRMNILNLRKNKVEQEILDKYYDDEEEDQVETQRRKRRLFSRFRLFRRK